MSVNCHHATNRTIAANSNTSGDNCASSDSCVLTYNHIVRHLALIIDNYTITYYGVIKCTTVYRTTGSYLDTVS